MAEVPGHITGRCYCGGITLSSQEAPQSVAYCHCIDCRRITGAPVAAFAAFGEKAVQASPAWPVSKSFAPGVSRWFCPDCGSPLAAAFDYLPGQLYVPLGLIDQAAELRRNSTPMKGAACRGSKSRTTSCASTALRGQPCAWLLTLRSSGKGCLSTTSVANLALPEPRPHPGLQDQPCRITAAVERPKPQAGAP